MIHATFLSRASSMPGQTHHGETARPWSAANLESRLACIALSLFIQEPFSRSTKMRCLLPQTHGGKEKNDPSGMSSGRSLVVRGPQHPENNVHIRCSSSFAFTFSCMYSTLKKNKPRNNPQPPSQYWSRPRPVSSPRILVGLLVINHAQ